MAPDPKTHRALACLLQDIRNEPPSGANLQALDDWSHRRVSTAALDAKIPAERINGRWYYLQADRQRIAEILGVLPKARIGRPPRRVVPHNEAAVAA
jgi:hypothetical protein